MGNGQKVKFKNRGNDMMKHRRYLFWSVAILLAAGVAVGGYFVRKFPTRAPLRPSICDRTGKTLLSDVRNFVFAAPTRHAECGGKFAAALLGHTIIKDGGRIGAGGVEALIDRNAMTGDRLLLTLDAGTQEKCEKLLDDIAAAVAPEYAHITILDSDGALIAAAQRPVIDLNDRSKVTPRETVFMASAYVFPVSDAWMRLLGSRSDAPPEEKLRFGFHRKLGIFPGEGKGTIPGGERYGTVENHAQSATALNFLLAGVGTMENREIPNLKIFLPDAAPRPALKITGKTHWHSILWSKDRSTLSALGKVPAGDTGLYILIRIAFRKTGAEGATAGGDALTEKMIRSFPASLPAELPKAEPARVTAKRCLRL